MYFLFLSVSPLTSRTLVIVNFIKSLISDLLFNKDTLPTIRTLLGSDAVSQMLIPPIFPKG